MAILDKFLKNKENIQILTEYSNILSNNGLKISNQTFELFDNFKFNELEIILNKNINAIIQMNNQGKSMELIQNFLDSDYYCAYENLPNYIKKDKNLQKVIIQKFSKSSLQEKLKIIETLKNMSNSNIMTLEDKEYVLKICLNDKTILQNKKLSLVLKGLPSSNLIILQNDLNLKKTKNEEEAYLNKVLEQRRKIMKRNEEIEKKKTQEEKTKKITLVNNDDYHIYNKEYYDFIKDKKLSIDKIDVIKHAYFQNGVNLENFKKDLGNDLYSCSREQLENYVTAYTRYQEGYLSREEYFFSKEIIEDNHITQKEIGEDVLPVIEKYDLTERQIKECVDMGAYRGEGDCKKFLDLAIEAKEHNYSNFEINELLDDCKEKSMRNTEFKTKMIHIYGKCSITEVDKLNEYTDKQMEILLKERELALELKGLPEFEIEEVNFDFK